MSTQYNVENSKTCLGPTVYFSWTFSQMCEVRWVLKMYWDMKITWMEGGHILPSQAHWAWETRNPIGWWSAAATCLSYSSFSRHSYDRKVFVRGKLPLTLKLWLSRLENSLLELGMATGRLDHSKLSWAAGNPVKRKKGRERWKKQQQKLTSCWLSLACWQKVGDFAASQSYTVTSCLENHKNK